MIEFWPSNKLGLCFLKVYIAITLCKMLADNVESGDCIYRFQF